MGYYLDENTFAYHAYKAGWWKKLKWRLGIGLQATTTTYTYKEWRQLFPKQNK